MHRILQKFSINELVLIAIMAALGIAMKPIVVPIAHIISGPLMIPSGALAGGFYMLWLVVGFGLVGKYGTGTLISLVQAFMIMFAGVAGSHGIMSLFSYTASGLLMDLVLLLIGHRVCCRTCSFLAGAVANVSGTFAVNLIFFRLPLVFLLMTIAVSILSGGIGGWIAWELIKLLRPFRLQQSRSRDAVEECVRTEEPDSLPGDRYEGEIPPAIYAKGLSVCYEEGKPVLSGVALSVPRGTVSVVLGLSGCGKSTLCHCVNGIVPFCRGESLEGAVYVNGERVGSRSLSCLAETVGTVMQDPDQQLVASTVEDELAFGLENQCMDPAEIEERIQKAMEVTGITDLRLRNPVRLSGGQKHLVAIASVLVMEPDILLLDEPLSHLDEEGQDMVIACMRKLREAGKTLFVVEHNFRRMEFADRWIVMENGRIVGTGTPEELLRDRHILKEAHLLSEEEPGNGSDRFKS